MGATAAALAYNVLLGYVTVSACLSLQKTDWTVWFLPVTVVLINLTVAVTLGPLRGTPIYSSTVLLLINWGASVAGATAFSQHHGPIPYNLTGTGIWAALTLAGTAVSIRAVRMWSGQHQLH